MRKWTKKMHEDEVVCVRKKEGEEVGKKELKIYNIKIHKKNKIIIKISTLNM